MMPSPTDIKPSFTRETALAKVRAAENAWNSRDSDRVPLAYSKDSEWHDKNGLWYRTHGNEHWEFDDDSLIRRRDMSANDIPTAEHERRLATDAANG